MLAGSVIAMMNKKTIDLLMCVVPLVMTLVGGCTGIASKEAVQATPTAVQEVVKELSTDADKEVAIIKTSEGEMVLEFYSVVAPNHVENFKKLAKTGFYDGTCFHRVVAGFMIQGGDPNSKDVSKKDSWGMGGPGYTINAEFNSKPHVRGTLSMAHASDPNSAGSQFFICHDDAPFLNGKFTVFGKLIKGYQTLDKIAYRATPSAYKSAVEFTPDERWVRLRSKYDPMKKPSEYLKSGRRERVPMFTGDPMAQSRPTVHYVELTSKGWDLVIYQDVLIADVLNGKPSDCPFERINIESVKIVSADSVK
jgi:peptidyl-prolyl cis-trans isomerase B (cyclophilin B)